MMMHPDRIEQWPLARLKPYARNAKSHDANQVAKIAASMAEFGWTVPVLVAADGELIAGHGRILAAAHLGLTEAPVIVLGHLTEAQRRAYRIADNKLTELGGWDEALLLQELQSLLAEDFDLGLIGITEDELDALLADADEFIFHFNRTPRKPHKTVPSKHAGETLGGGGLRGADGTVHAKTGTGNAIQSHRIPDSVFRIMRHKGGLGAAGSHPAVFPVALVEAVLTAFSDPGDLIYEPFCGSGMGLPGEPLLGALGTNPYWARNWMLFGQDTKPVTGAVLVFERGSGGHVGFAVGQDDSHFFVLGGNQSDAVTIARIAKTRLLGARWPATFPPRFQRLPTMKPGEFLATTNEI